MSIRQVSCPVRVLFLDAELADLDAVPGGVEVPPQLWCALEAGHEGRHAVEAQFGGGPTVAVPYSIWVRWPGDDEYGPLREFGPLPGCTETFLEGLLEQESCVLFAGHPGRHDFEFGPPLTFSDLPPDLRTVLGDSSGEPNP